MTAEFNMTDILIALKQLSDNGIDRVELQFDKNGCLVMQGQNKHIIRPRIIPIRINNNDITGSLVQEALNKNNNKLSFSTKIKGLLGW